MSYLTWSTTPNLNVTVNGISIAEGMAPGNVNDAMRAIMAGVASLRDDLPSTAGLAPLSGPVFTGTQPRYAGRGAFLHHNSTANLSGRVYVLSEGSALPSGPSNGDIVFFFS